MSSRLALAVAAIVALPCLATGQPTTPMRVILSDGLIVNGCGTLVNQETLSFRPNAVISSRRSRQADCEQGNKLDRWLLQISHLKSIQLPQSEKHVTEAATRGAALGALAGAGLYWTASTSRCKSCLVNTPTDWAVAGALVGGMAGAMYGNNHPETVWVPQFGATASEQKAGVLDWLLRYAKVEGTAGAGFAGIRVAEVLKTRLADTTYFPVVNYRYDWRPAVSTGLVTYVYTPKTSQLGVGVGVQIVALPTTEGKAPPFPAITLHFGVPQTEFFVGLVLSPTDSVALPDTINGLGGRFPNSVDPKQLVVSNVRSSRHIYMGIQIKGTRKGTSDLGVPENSQVVFDTDTEKADSIRMRAHLEDPNGNSLPGPQPEFTVAFGNDSAKIEMNWLKPNANTAGGFAVVRARIGSKEAYHGFTVVPKKANDPATKTSDTTKTPATPADTAKKEILSEFYSGRWLATSKAPVSAIAWPSDVTASRSTKRVSRR